MSRKKPVTTMAQLQKVIRPVVKAKYQVTSVLDQVSGSPRGEFTVEQLALAADVTVRTIRNYQDKGLLDPPRLQGRKGYYSQRHLSRLKLISGLIDRGFAVNAIRELLLALEKGVGIDEFLGVESAITSPWSDEEPTTISLLELYEKFPNDVDPETLNKANQLGVFTHDGVNVRVSSMSLLEVGERLTATGIPLLKLLNILERTQKNVQQVANDFVSLVTTHVLEPYDQGELPPKEAFPELSQLVWELRPLAQKAVSVELSKAMAEAANTFLADKLAQIFDKQGHKL